MMLWAYTISVWLIASYAIAPDCLSETEGKGRRTAKLLAATLFAGGIGWLLPPEGTDHFARLVLSGVLLTFVACTALLRLRLIPKRAGFLPETEIAANIGFMVVSALVIGMGTVGWGGASVLYSGKVTAIACLVAGVVATFRCGTYVVRGVLDRAGAVPIAPKEGTADPESSANKAELGRGRSIGNLERLLMIIAVGAGRYEVLGFLVAAKGLIRSREFEERNFAEYFILGSIASTTVALVLGMALRASVSYFWKMKP